MITITSKPTKKLSKDEIKKICILKNSWWKFGFKSQLNYFKNNIKPNDLHNCLYINNQLIGYTLLRKRKQSQNRSKRRNYKMTKNTITVYLLLMAHETFPFDVRQSHLCSSTEKKEGLKF